MHATTRPGLGSFEQSACIAGRPLKEVRMLSYAVTFFVIALIAAVLGFNGVAGLSADIGWLFAVIAGVLLVVALVSGRGGRLSV
jgi:uncharacterized membrane protein YtjA (UPF0391 family)